MRPTMLKDLSMRTAESIQRTLPPSTMSLRPHVGTTTEKIPSLRFLGARSLWRAPCEDIRKNVQIGRAAVWYFSAVAYAPGLVA